MAYEDYREQLSQDVQQFYSDTYFSNITLDEYTGKQEASFQEYADVRGFELEQATTFYEQYSALSDIEKQYVTDKTYDTSLFNQARINESGEISFGTRVSGDIFMKEQEAYAVEQQAELEEQRQKLESEKLVMRRKETAKRLISGSQGSTGTEVLTTNEEVKRRQSLNQITGLDTVDIV